ncbi:unnamed protein product [Leptosia nina]|uniref:Uncharacterized protein n=1 Tax=Leptosia nina TaxID=320188 RepID=A0AAV1JMY9_9NEOP
MSTTATRHVKSSNSANILMCKQWWKVCWMYGDQEKYYRQLYGRRKINTLNDINKGIFDTDAKRPGAHITELTDDFFKNHTTPDDKEWFGGEEPDYGFEYDQRRKPINLNDIHEITQSISLPHDDNDDIHRSIIGKRHTDRQTVSRTNKGVLNEKTDVSTSGRSMASLQRSSGTRETNKIKEVLQPVNENSLLDESVRRKCLRDTLQTTTLVSVTQQMVACCNE